MPSTGGAPTIRTTVSASLSLRSCRAVSALDDGDRAARKLDALGRVADEERRGALEDDEQLLLDALEVAGAACAGRQAPDVGAHLVEGLGERRATPPPVAPLRRLERALLGPEDGVSHGGKLAEQPRKRKPARAGHSSSAGASRPSRRARSTASVRVVTSSLA